MYSAAEVLLSQYLLHAEVAVCPPVAEANITCGVHLRSLVHP